MTRFARRRALARGRDAQHVILRIERLTLEGVSRIEGQRIADRLTIALSRTLEEHDLPETSRRVDHDVLAATASIGGLPEDTGAALAGLVAGKVLS